MPQWTEEDYAFSRLVAANTRPSSFVPYANTRIEELTLLREEVGELSSPETRGSSMGGGSDDIGDIMWTVPTITIRYPSNIPNTTGHHVTAAMAMATLIAHKGAVAGAKAVAMTAFDLITDSELLESAK